MKAAAALRAPDPPPPLNSTGQAEPEQARHGPSPAPGLFGPGAAIERLLAAGFGRRGDAARLVELHGPDAVVQGLAMAELRRDAGQRITRWRGYVVRLIEQAAAGSLEPDERTEARASAARGREARGRLSQIAHLADALIQTARMNGYDPADHARERGWSDGDWRAACDELAEAGLLPRSLQS